MANYAASYFNDTNASAGSQASFEQDDEL